MNLPERCDEEKKSFFLLRIEAQWFGPCMSSDPFRVPCYKDGVAFELTGLVY
jgi:hypothetical protein